MFKSGIHEESFVGRDYNDYLHLVLCLAVKRVLVRV